jgi:sulfate adenylyltransferase subunit 2
MSSYRLSHLDLLEAEGVRIIREVAAEFDNPVMLYSVGKDSAVMLRLARKAFAPGRIPFPLLHVDTDYKFREMIAFRDRHCREIGVDLRVHRNEEAIANKTNPWGLGTSSCCGLLKTQALLSALKEGGYDAAFGGARRDEERSRAKERVYSHRDEHGRWDPKNQRPELWSLYNSHLRQGENMRVFPLSNWTELDIWFYIRREDIPIVPMYYAKEREMVVRGQQLIPTEGEFELREGEKVETVMSRFRTLGCWPCTGAVRSNAVTIDEIISELMDSTISERSTRIIDHDRDGSMELKKREGYF